MDRTAVVASVAGDLNATEQAIDAAITSATTLVQSMIGARTMLNVSPTSGAAAQARAIEAIAALSAAREAIVASHAELYKAHRRQGWGTYNVGGLDKPSDWDAGSPPGGISESRLNRVA